MSLNHFMHNVKQFFGITSFQQKDSQFQLTQSFKLRQLAIDHLRNGHGVVAKGFRANYLTCMQAPYEDFLEQQARNGEWGTYIEFTALCEKFGVKGVVTPVKNGVTQSPICLYRPEADNAPTIHLYNSNNSHWYVNSKTLADGNCLYNAFAQAIRNLCKTEERHVKAPQHPPIANTRQPALFHSISNEDSLTIKQQAAIAKAIKKQPKPSELEQQQAAEAERIHKLPSEEQEQIRNDYLLALKLAREEGLSSNTLFNQHHNVLTTTSNTKACKVN